MTKSRIPEDGQELMRPREVAALFRVAPKTVGHWADLGRISYIRTPGGQRRYPRSEVMKLLDGESMSGG